MYCGLSRSEEPYFSIRRMDCVFLVHGSWTSLESSNSCFCTFLHHQISLYFSLPFIINILFCREHVMPLRMPSQWDTSESWWSSHHWNFSGPKCHCNRGSQGAAPGRKPVISLVYEPLSLSYQKEFFKQSFSCRIFF